MKAYLIFVSISCLIGIVLTSLLFSILLGGL